MSYNTLILKLNLSNLTVIVSLHTYLQISKWIIHVVRIIFHASKFSYFC